MSLPPGTLYGMLPAHVRIRDREEGEPLRALLSVMEQTATELHDDIGRLYRNWFIETCQEWVVPYVGDLVGIARLKAMSPKAYTLRAYVANAIALRRRKGTPASLEQVAQDVTGWHAAVMEMFERISATQHIKHPRPGALRMPALRNSGVLELLYAPFETANHSLDVRGLNRDPVPGVSGAPASGPVTVLTRRDRGRYNLQTVTLFLWRLRAWPVALAPAAVKDVQDSGGHLLRRWYGFNQLGTDLPLFNFPQTKLEASSLAQEHHLPGRLRRSALFAELEALRQAEVDGVDPTPAWFGAQPPFRIHLRPRAGGALVEVPPSQLLIADLSGCDQATWPLPPALRTYYKAAGGTADLPIAAVVDPELGRVVFTQGHAPDESTTQVLVSYYYGFSSDLGGGTYDRHADLAPTAGYSRYQASAAGGPQALQQQLAQWVAEAPNTPGAVVEVLDNFVYTIDPAQGGSLQVPDGKRLEIRAANRQRPVVQLLGDVTITLGRRSTLVLDGLWVHGGRITVAVQQGGPASVAVRHATLAPDSGGAGGAPLRITAAAGAEVAVSVLRSITGALELGALGPGCALELQDSIVDRQDQSAGLAIDFGGAVRASASTVLGATRAGVLELASDMLFTGNVMSERRQSGGIRFSYAPDGSELPPRFQCQPEIPPGATPAVREAILYSQNPRFTSVQYGQPGYCQLVANMPDEILRGASDEGEMGAFNHLEQSQRTLNLRAALTEYLRLGLDAGLIFVT